MEMKKIITLTGASLSGKTSICKEIEKLSCFRELISITTRPPRSGEEEGIHYYFKTNEEYNNIPKIDFIEEIYFNNYDYAIHKDELNDKENGLIVAEPRGVEQINRYCQENDIKVFNVYLYNSMEVLLQRFKDRYNSDLKARENIYRDRMWNLFMYEMDWVNKINYNSIIDCDNLSINEIASHIITLQYLTFDDI